MSNTINGRKRGGGTKHKGYCSLVYRKKERKERKMKGIEVWYEIKRKGREKEIKGKG